MWAGEEEGVGECVGMAERATGRCNIQTADVAGSKGHWRLSVKSIMCEVCRRSVSWVGRAMTQACVRAGVVHCRCASRLSTAVCLMIIRALLMLMASEMAVRWYGRNADGVQREYWVPSPRRALTWRCART